MHVHNLHPKIKIRRGKYKTKYIERYQQIIVSAYIGFYRNIFRHQAIEMRTIPTYHPLSVHKHQ